MKIQKVKFQNFRNVPDIEKELNGSNIILLAENTKGKSNFIKGLQAALAGTIGKDAIRHGADKSEIEVLANDFNENGEPIPGTDYVFKLKIRKDKEGDEKVTLEVTAPNGLRETRKTVIGSIAGEIELDYNFVELSKTQAGKKKQLEIIKSYLPEELKEQLRIWESKVQKAYDDRTEINRAIKTIEGFIKSCGINPDDFKTYSEKVDTASLLQQRDAIMKKNAEIQGVKQRVEERAKSAEKIEYEIAVFEKKIADLRNELVEIATKNSDAKKYLAENSTQDTATIDEQLSSANTHNIKHQQVTDLKVKQKELEQLLDESGDLTALYESTKEAISNAIRDMDFPIEGITFDSENVYYHGKMVDESTLSTAEIMMLEVELKMSKAPGAEVVFIQRGESLGKQMLTALQQKAKERGYQLIMEQVERGTEELKIELMPDFTNELAKA